MDEKENKPLKEVEDQNSNLHILTEALPAGGQGVVYRTADPAILVKISSLKSVSQEAKERERKRLVAHYRHVRLLPVPTGLPMALPIATLKDEAGYVMECLIDMVPLADISGKEQLKSEEEIPAWIDSAPDEKTKLSLWRYSRTGGLKRRLLILSSLAETMARLHLGGLVYGDLSPNNVFVSELGPDSSLGRWEERPLNVWLIDTDNLKLAGSWSTPVKTPDFGAPEIVRGEDTNTTMSDDWSLAVLAFSLLTQKMPFAGQLLEQAANEDDWASDEKVTMAEQAERGELPWVGDSEDDSNEDHDMFGALRPLRLSPALLALFDAAFGREGRCNPMSRPTALLWARELRRAADSLVLCPECGEYYYANGEKCACPFCDAVPSLLGSVAVMEKRENAWVETLLAPIQAAGCVSLPLRYFAPCRAGEGEEKLAYLELKDKKIFLRKDPYAKLSLFWAGKETRGAFRQVNLRLELGGEDEERTVYLYAGERPTRLVRCHWAGR